MRAPRSYLAAVALFSGGAGNFNPYGKPVHGTPVLALYGGPSDVFGGGFINFDQMTNSLADNLLDDGHFVILCNHGGGHQIPLDPMVYAMPFLFGHRLTVPQSPYAAGLGSEWADFCAIHGAE